MVITVFCGTIKILPAYERHTAETWIPIRNFTMYMTVTHHWLFVSHALHFASTTAWQSSKQNVRIMCGGECDIHCCYPHKLQNIRSDLHASVISIFTVLLKHIT